MARQADDEFAVIACDGIWDVMSSQEVVEKVHAFLANGRPPPQLLDADANDDGRRRTDGGGRRAAGAAAAQRPWDLGAVCEELIDHCLRLGSRDNMSVVIVLFQKGLLSRSPRSRRRRSEGEGEGVAGRRMRWGMRRVGLMARRFHCVFL